MNRTIASVAVILTLLVQAPVDAQQRRVASRGTAQVRPSQATHAVRTTAPASQPKSTTVLRTAKATPRVARATHDEVVYDDGYVDGGYDGSEYYDDGIVSGGGDDCSSCSVGLIGGGSSCHTCSAPNQFCICFPSHGWVQADYLNWYPSGMRTPPLVTTSTPSTIDRAQAGVLELPTTSILFGGDDILDNSWSGFRIRFGWWLAALPGWGVEGEYVGFGERTESFYQKSDGTPIIARPFFNSLEGQEDAQLVAYPNLISGDIAVDAISRFDGAAVRFRRQMCCQEGCGYSNISCQTVPTASRLDTTIGYRFWELKESLQVQEQLTTFPPDPGAFDIIDRFDTRNLFNGAELGVLWQGRRGWWSLDMLMRLGIGNNNQTVTINGSTAITENGTTTERSGGLLAQQGANIGTYERNQFTMVPELGATLGYQVTQRLRATMGYSLVYMGNVVRPGDQVDLNVNPTLLPSENVPFTGPLRPQFHFVETDYLIQGLNFGGEFRW